MSQKSAGVYKITCKATGWVYIGKSNNVLTRWMFHKFKLEAGTHMNKRLQNQWNHYGAVAFAFEVIELLDDPHDELLAEREIYWMAEYHREGPLFNVHGMGFNGSRG